MTWLLPTKGRIKDLRRFLEAARETGTSTPGLILVNRDELEQHSAEYAAALMVGPRGWEVRAVDADCYGEAVRQAWEWVKDDPWIGLVADDLIPSSGTWDAELLKSLTGWNMVSANDGWQANQDINKGRLHGAIAWSGDLARAVGWIFPPGLKHIFHDDVWETLGRETSCWSVRMDVMTRHDHASLHGIKGPTMDPNSELWKHDQEWFETWRDIKHSTFPEWDGGKAACVERIQKLMALRGVKRVDVDLTGLHIMVATPSASGRPEISYIVSLLNTFEFFKAKGATVQWATECYTADISLARMKLLGAFVRSKASHLLMIDDDMGWSIDAIVRLFYANKDFVAIAGPKKRYPLSFAASHTNRAGDPIGLQFDQATGCMEVTDVGAAFVLLKRSTVERIIAAYPELRCDNISSEPHWAVFNPGIFNGEYKSEDFAFCRRWKKIGGQVFMVPDVPLKHTGSHQFEGCFAQTMVPTEQPAPLMEAAE